MTGLSGLLFGKTCGGTGIPVSKTNLGQHRKRPSGIGRDSEIEPRDILIGFIHLAVLLAWLDRYAIPGAHFHPFVIHDKDRFSRLDMENLEHRIM
jgi:hypothetical protein